MKKHFTNRCRIVLLGLFPLAAQAALRFEVEAYDAPFAAEGVATTDHWQYLSLNVGLRWRLGR